VKQALVLAIFYGAKPSGICQKCWKNHGKMMENGLSERQSTWRFIARKNNGRIIWQWNILELAIEV
jgi:hypothetical protein